MNNKGSGLIGLIAAALCIAAVIVLHSFFPSLGKLIFWLLGIAALGIAAVVVLVIVLAFRGNRSGKGKAAGERPEEILSRGRRNVTEIRRQAVRIKNPGIRELCGEICTGADKILRELRHRPEAIPDVRKFFNYYLPTLSSIMGRYSRIEQSGTPAEEMTESALACLRDICSAMERQYSNLFTNDIFDLTVEMEVMTMMCRRDGLIDEENEPFKQGKTMGLSL